MKRLPTTECTYLPTSAKNCSEVPTSPAQRQIPSNEPCIASPPGLAGSGLSVRIRSAV